MQKPFEVGDKVAVVTRGAVAPDMYRVARVMKRFVELDDGSRWNLQGGPYPATDWPHQRIAHWTDRHTRACRIADAIRIARNIVERLRDNNLIEAGQLADELQETLRKVEA